MSDETAVTVEGVEKKFRLFDSPKARLMEALHPFRKKLHREHWALKDVSFKVRRGETLGILGKNGSGKSTLLQIICNVMQPTGGRVNVCGRVSALLELGAGFNPLFTGRQNVLLGGAFVGVSEDEMQTRLPEIEAFADVGEFFDQPVRTYSSGMYVRVAFAAAIHVNPDILVIDEALAVGDVRFQHKCYQRIDRLRDDGKTIILVTHDIGQITGHCDRAVLIDDGRVISLGAPRDVVDHYIERMFGQPQAVVSDAGNELLPQGADTSESCGLNVPEMVADKTRLEDRPIYCPDESRYGDRRAELLDCFLESGGVAGQTHFDCGAIVKLYLKVRCDCSFSPSFGFAVKSVSGIEVYGSNTFMQGVPVAQMAVGQIYIVCFTFALPLRPAEYFFDIGVTEVDGSTGGAAVDVRRSAVMIRLVDKPDAAQFVGVMDLAPEFQLLI